MARASESTHWYDREGNPCYTQKSAKGTDRATTLADARKLLLRVSVTTVLKVPDKPMLNQWFKNQMMLAFLTLPKVEGESLQQLEARIWEDANAHSEMARARGTAIHAEIENGFVADNDNPYYVAVKELLDTLYPNYTWIPEISFATKTYGGKIDLVGKREGCKAVIIDFKVKEFKDTDDVAKMIYDEHGMQLSAYGHGLGYSDFDRMNLFIRPIEAGGIAIKHYLHEANDKHWRMFIHLLNYWMLSKNYFCELENDNEII